MKGKINKLSEEERKEKRRAYNKQYYKNNAEKIIKQVQLNKKIMLKQLKNINNYIKKIMRTNLKIITVSTTPSTT